VEGSRMAAGHVDTHPGRL